MSPRSAAAAIARGAATTVHAPTRARPVRRPAPTRRRSGAAARPATRAVPRHDFVGILDRLLRGPAYIAVIGVLLAGIVFFNVDVLELNRGVAQTDIRSSELKRENAALTLKLGSSERIQRVALDRGLVLPQPGDVRYLRANREDAAHALRVMTAPESITAAPVTATLLTQQSTQAQSNGVTTAPGTTPQALSPSAEGTTTEAPTTTTTTAPATTPTTTTTTTPAAAPATTTQGGAAAPPATP